MKNPAGLTYFARHFLDTGGNRLSGSFAIALHVIRNQVWENLERSITIF